MKTLKFPPKTYCTRIIFELDKQEDLELIHANYSAIGIEALYKDKKDSQSYHVSINPIGKYSFHE